MFAILVHFCIGKVYGRSGLVHNDGDPLSFETEEAARDYARQEIVPLLSRFDRFEIVAAA